MLTPPDAAVRELTTELALTLIPRFHRPRWRLRLPTSEQLLAHDGWLSFVLPSGRVLTSTRLRQDPIESAYRLAQQVVACWQQQGRL